MIHRLLTLLALVFAAQATAQVTGYSDAPLQKPHFEEMRVVVESMALNNWLNANYAKLTPQHRDQIRDRLHGLIDSKVKAIYARDKSIRPLKDDPVLGSLYVWAGRMGVYGADEVYSALRGTLPFEPPPGPRMPEGLSLSLDGDLLKLKSADGGWVAGFPYYFFVFNAQSLRNDEGRHVELAAISMGTAPDAAPPGFSQATIMVMFTPAAGSEAFVRRFLERSSFPVDGELKKVESTGFESRTSFDPKSRLHREVVVVPSTKGPIVATYLGLDGTYQWNRVHFVDFLRNLKVDQ